MAGELTADDIRQGIGLAKEDIDSVSEEIRSIARDNRIEVLKDDERKEFFDGMTQREFDFLHKIAVQMGPKGLNKLEQLMGEAVEGFAVADDG